MKLFWPMLCEFGECETIYMRRCKIHNKSSLSLNGNKKADKQRVGLYKK